MNNGASEFAKKAAEARAKSLSPERRSEIARKAVMTRWENSAEKNGVLRVVAGNPNRVLKIGDVELDCYVLENGQRVISGKSMHRAFGFESTAGNRLMQFLNKNAIRPFLEAKFDQRKFLSVKFRQPVTKNMTVLANGYDANVLKTACDVILAYRRFAGNNIKESEKLVAEKAEILLSGFASVGIIALIDEVTGYQEIRAKDELQKILAAYVSPELLKWTQRFPLEFYKQLFKVYGWEFSPLSVKRPMAVGKLTETLIYEKLPVGVLEELRNKNPKNESGNRNHRHHQFLTEEIGNPHLDKQISTVTTLLRISDDKEQFKSLFAKAFPDNPDQTRID